MKLDILAFGAHPDDVELSCAGTLMVEIGNDKRVGIIDLTQGEMGSRGTIETRYAEAAQAAKIMGITVRKNLKMQDAFFTNDKENQLKIIQVIRKYQPEIVLCNAPEDRHPDHGKGSSLLEDACFLSGLRKIETIDDNGSPQQAWRPKHLFHYIQDRYLHPNFVVDISTVHDKKIEAIKAYSTQFFNPNLNEPQTYISTPDFLEGVIYRSKMYGKMIGVAYAEGFISKKMIGVNNLDAIIANVT